MSGVEPRTGRIMGGVALGLALGCGGGSVGMSATGTGDESGASAGDSASGSGSGSAEGSGGASDTAESTASGTDSAGSAGDSAGSAGDSAGSGSDDDATGSDSASADADSGSGTNGGTNSGGDGDGDGDGDAGDGDSSGSAGDSGGDDGIGMPSQCECADNTELIYTLSDNGGLWSYDPVFDAWEHISDPDCGPGFTPFSMAVRRDGTAWLLNWSDSRLYQTDVNDPSGACNVVQGFTPFQQGFDVFGMAFVSNSVQDPCEQLYLYNGDWSSTDGRIGRVYPEGTPLFVQLVGDTHDYLSELTGNANGRMFAFSYGTQPELVEWRKSDATELQRVTLPFSNNGAWAFATWDGDFYFFTDPGFGGSVVTHYDFLGSGDFTERAPAPATMLGAGVSTCAPAPM